MANSRRALLALLRLFISGGLLAFFIWYASPQQIWQSWRRLDATLLLLALALQMLGNVVSAAKWQLVLRAQGHRLPYGWLLGLYMVGQFANNFLPTTVGGDAVRATQLGGRIGSYGQATASVLVERVTGFWALSVLGGVALFYAVGLVEVTPVVVLLMLGCAAATTVALLLLPRSGLMRGLLGRLPLPAKLRGGFETLIAALGTVGGAPGPLLLVLLLSLLFQSIWIAMHVVAGAALGLPIPFVLYAFLVPLTDILGLVPLFFNNLGVRESVFVLYMGQIGIGRAEAVAVAVLVFSIRLAISLIGGLLLLVGGLRGAREVLAGQQPTSPQSAQRPQSVSTPEFTAEAQKRRGVDI